MGVSVGRVGDAVGVSVAGVGDIVGVLVGERGGSVGGIGEGGSGVGGVVAVGRGSVGEGCRMAIACVGDGGSVGASSWLSRKLPSSIPTLTSVTIRPTSNWPIPVASLALVCIRWLNVATTPYEG